MTREEWESAAREGAAIAYQAGNDPFIIDLLCSVYSELEREYRKQEEKGEGVCELSECATKRAG